jgi:transposase InsO family protein
VKSTIDGSPTVKRNTWTRTTTNEQQGTESPKPEEGTSDANNGSRSAQKPLPGTDNQKPANDHKQQQGIDETAKIFSGPGKQAAYDYLVNGTVPSQHTGRGNHKGRKSFRQNMKKRFKLEGGKMYMKRRDGTNKNVTTNSRFDRRLKVSQTPWREVLADGDITRVLETAHAKNHNGERRLKTDMSTLYVVHDLHRHTKLVCGDGCGVCSMWSAEPPKPVRAIISEYPLHLVMFDLTTMPFPDEDGYEYLLLVVDHFTKYSWGVTVPNKEATTIADYLYDLFTMFNVPVPTRWHCDNGGEFINWAMTLVCEKLGVVQSTSLPRNPQCQGLVEERNRVLKRKVEQKALEWVGN